VIKWKVAIPTINAANWLSSGVVFALLERFGISENYQLWAGVATKEMGGALRTPQGHSWAGTETSPGLFNVKLYTSVQWCQPHFILHRDKAGRKGVGYDALLLPQVAEVYYFLG
jgi:hypothetical protein